MTLRISTPSEEGVYQGSKYLKFQVFCDASELAGLFQRLDPFWMFPLTGLTDGRPIDPARFLDEYASWIEGIKQGRIPTDAELRKILACGMTADLDAFWLQEAPGNRYLMKISQPVIQVQAHFFTYSSIDGVFRPMTMGTESIFWGLQFSFPQIYQNPKTMELDAVEESANTKLFEKVRLWVRDATRATPFLVEGKRVNAPIRIGKKSVSWIGRHPQLIAKNLGIWEAEPVYREQMKNRQIDQEGSSDFLDRASGIVKDKTRSENEKYEVKSTQVRSDSSFTSGIDAS